MIGNLISALFNFILNLIATVIQLICLPLNLLITNLLPDLSNNIQSVVTGISQLMNTLPWALSILPLTFLNTLAICWGLKLIISNISISTRSLIKVWNVLQKIKFW
ncbi:hypothetical protein IJH46_01820 [Candidatus Saccharibacteria bacterium]|nr:hypothetical protein [Candidatus Saccharibacteria bacterium]